jgi:hypothetical protein
MIKWEELIKTDRVEEQRQRIDGTNWRTVMNHLLSPVSEIAQIILVNREDDLPRVAAFFIDPQIDDDTDTAALMNEFKKTQTFALVFNRNKIEQTNPNDPDIIGEDISAIPAGQSVTGIFAPPCYIVHIANSDKLISSFRMSD